MHRHIDLLSHHQQERPGWYQGKHYWMNPIGQHATQSRCASVYFGECPLPNIARPFWIPRSCKQAASACHQGPSLRQTPFCLKLLYTAGFGLKMPQKGRIPKEWGFANGRSFCNAWFKPLFFCVLFTLTIESNSFVKIYIDLLSLSHLVSISVCCFRKLIPENSLNELLC